MRGRWRAKLLGTLVERLLSIRGDVSITLAVIRSKNNINRGRDGYERVKEKST